MSEFNLVSKYKPAGDQVKAIEVLMNNFESGSKEQVLLGATGTGKTFTISNIIEKLGKKTLILAHNKTLAGQLYGEFKEFFPENKVEYFISYYDYYQPEAYVVSSDTYIEKDSKTNDEIDELRHSATARLLDDDDVIVIASVSCIYGIGDPDDYKKGMLVLRVGDEIGRKPIVDKLVEMLYQRNDIDFARGTFRVRGDVIEIIPIYERALGLRIELFGDEIDRIRRFNVVTGEIVDEVKNATLYPATHFMTDKDKLEESIRRIEEELKERVKYFKDNNLLVEAQRIEQRTRYDIEMLREVGTCSGVENYSRHIALRDEGETPACLIDFFGEDWLLIVDESHVTLPQVRGMYNGDRARKQNLVNYGFRLPSALDNRPLQFPEFEDKIKRAIYVSATPGDYELQKDLPIIQQIIRPTGLLDPIIEVRKTNGQIEDLVSEIKSLERLQIIRELRMGKYDVLIGINLLREGLDLPEVSLVCILDADKQGFLRSHRSLIQTIGRAARNSEGRVIMYADTISDAMAVAIEETNRRREIQIRHNEENGITPTTIVKDVHDAISNIEEHMEEGKDVTKLTKSEKIEIIAKMEEEMLEAARNLDFEKAASLRDTIIELKSS